MDSNEKHDFFKILKEFIPDFKKEYPDYEFCHELVDSIENYDDMIYQHSKNVFPERFFDIIYQNDDIFENDEIRTDFLYKVDFKDFWKTSSEQTQVILWKYLQLFLFSIVSDLENNEAFGDATKMFESINDDEFKEKLEETIKDIHGFFENSNMNDINADDLPKAENIHEHLNNMLDGNIGKIAKEIAADIIEDEENPEQLFQSLLQNPSKLMKLTKNIGNKLDSKMKDENIQQGDLLKEANEMMTKLKGMPGVDNIFKMFGKNMNEVSKNNTRTRLQEKLKQRQQNKIIGEGKNQVFKIDDNTVTEKSKRINKKKKKKKK